MSQHDFDLTTADANTGPTVRAGINAMAQALASNSSGATAPVTTYPCQNWSDTTSGRKKQRNSTNTSWIDCGPLDVNFAIGAMQGVTTTSGGTADAITLAFTPSMTSLTATPIWWRATGANTSTTPTVQRDALAAKTLVKGNNLPLSPGDIPGAGAWMCSQYDATLDKEVLLNPARGLFAGNRSGRFLVTGALTLTAAHAGSYIDCQNSTSYSVTLPLASTVVAGTQLEIINSGSGSSVVTVVRQGTDGFYSTTNTSFLTFGAALGVGDTAIVEFNGVSWILVGGTVSLKYSAVFAASVGASGYRKYPDGTIEQWSSYSTPSGGSVAITFPTTFPNNFYGISYSQTGANVTVGFTSLGLSGVTINTYLANTGAAVANSGYYRVWGN